MDNIDNNLKAIIGSFGETYTLQYLLQNGYESVKNNYHSNYGEIDIIVKNQTYIAFVEVKTRTEDYLYAPALAVTKSKQKKIIKTALMFLQQSENLNLQPRFDVAEIVIKKGKTDEILSFNYIENAFLVGDENRYF